MIIDASNLIMGRLASYVAKQAMLGNKVDIVNSEKAVISGKRENVFNDYLSKREMGTPFKGPFISRLPDRLLRRAIRGMLPYKKPRGREAYKKIMCYTGVPNEFKDKKFTTIESANISKLPNLKFTDLRTLSKRLGAKID
jgi:large subunit ribosomal protein L13